MAKATKKEAGKSLKAKNFVRTIDQMSIARQISEKLGYKISDILAVVEEDKSSNSSLSNFSNKMPLIFCISLTVHCGK